MRRADRNVWHHGGSPEDEGGFRWSTLLWALIYPQRRQRVIPTLSGVILIALSLGLGTAAYNAANNILFITLSLLLACLILSGVLSWLNFRGVEWRLEITPPLRAGEVTLVTLGVRNTKRVLPTYGLSFEMVARMVDQGPAAKAESTLTASGIDVRAALARAEKTEANARLVMRTRLDPGESTQLEWTFQPQRRGLLRIELARVGSLFPFGFLKKENAVGLHEEVLVWPALVQLRRFAVATVRQPASGERLMRAGAGNDLLALRRYAQGDSHRAIHWKASARMRQLLVRQFAAEGTQGFAIWLNVDRHIWTHEAQFELLLSVATTLAEDLFRAGQLTSVAIDAEQPISTRRVRDVESFLDRIALVEGISQSLPQSGAGTRADPTVRVPITRRRKNLITFAPDGSRGVDAYVDGEKIASA
jgi:uncharacterized protein (DUF58 family)